MRKIVRLTENDLTRLVRRVIKESEQNVEAEQTVSEINSMLTSAGLPGVSLITLIDADDSVLESMEKRYSTEPEPTTNKNVDVEALKEKVKTYYCSLQNNKQSLKDELRKLLNLRKSIKPIKEGIDKSDLVYVIGFAIILLIVLITGIKRRRYGCPVNAWNGFGPGR
jgi:hypothetical protein